MKIIVTKKKDEAYIKNLDIKQSKGIHWISLFINRNVDVYFDFLGIKYIFLKMYQAKSMVNPTYLKHNLTQFLLYPYFIVLLSQNI